MDRKRSDGLVATDQMSQEIARRVPDLIDVVPVALLVTDRNGLILFINSALRRMFGYSEADLVGQRVGTLLPERFRDRHQQYHADYFIDPSPRAMGVGRELFALHADGHEFPVEIGLVPLASDEAAASDEMWAIATVIDVSLRKDAEASFHSIFDTGPIGKVIVDKAGLILCVNPYGLKLLGYQAGDLEGSSVEVIVPHQFREKHPAQRETYLCAPSSREMGARLDVLALCQDGTEFPAEIRLSPLTWKGQPATMATIVDIAERKAMELELRKANDHLEEFVYVASHDLKSPLLGITDLMEWITEDLGDDITPAVTNNLERVRVRVRRMERLLDDLLAYAWAGRVVDDLSLVDLEQIMLQMVEVLPPDHKFIITTDLKVQPFKGHAVPLATVFRNLISNALKHHDRSDGHISIQGVEDGTFCVFTIADDGPGIPPEARERVFKLFKTLNSSKKGRGSGIGLALVKRLVESHGGRITLDDGQNGRGVTFKFWWPRFPRRMDN